MSEAKETYHPLTGSAMKVQVLDELICRCPKCQGTLDRAQMCAGCLASDKMISELQNAPGHGTRYPAYRGTGGDRGCWNWRSWMKVLLADETWIAKEDAVCMECIFWTREKWPCSLCITNNLRPYFKIEPDTKKWPAERWERENERA